MKLKCVSSFSNHEHSFEAGQEVNVSDEEAALLLRCSRESFNIPTPEKPEPAPVPDTSAMSTETQTGLTAPDRRARGGRKRTTKKRGGSK
jgi:hypothetical protein